MFPILTDYKSRIGSSAFQNTATATMHSVEVERLTSTAAREGDVDVLARMQTFFRRGALP